VLTAEGEQYFAAVSEHLNGIREATEKLTGRHTLNILRVRAHTTISMKWLISRLGTFHAENKSSEVRLTTSNEAVNFERENVDGAILFGTGEWSGVEVDRLMANEIAPLCSPAFCRAHRMKSVQDLAHLPLLHSLVRPDDWRYWLEAAGAKNIDPYSGDKYASSILAYQASLEGHGIMMAQRVLFLDDLRTKRLVQPFDFTLDRGALTYYFVYPRTRLRNPAFRRFRSWLLAQVAGSLFR
jgi:LysR family glycine cleavage system transcriptional activator